MNCLRHLCFVNVYDGKDSENAETYSWQASVDLLGARVEKSKYAHLSMVSGSVLDSFAGL